MPSNGRNAISKPFKYPNPIKNLEIKARITILNSAAITNKRWADNSNPIPDKPT